VKTLLTTLNAKFVHSSLALRYLRVFCADKPYKISLKEFTINDRLEFITAEIYRENANIVAFSTYIWNVGETLAAARRLKQVMEEVTIILGGPEVTFDSIKLMEDYPFIDYIVRGEGEITFRELMKYLVECKGEAEDIRGITYRRGSRVIVNPDRPFIENLDIIPFPYSTDENLENKIIYYEASRGCPYQCQYCLSSTIKGVRFFSIERVKNDLEKLINLGVKQVKFVDRTFNCNARFAAQIFRFLIEKGGQTGFHFEISADLLNKELLEILENAPQGFFQFEVGVQTTNLEVLKEIRRKSSLDLLFKNVVKIKEYNNIHQHLDLIAGLPGEDITSFGKSFDDVFALRPDMFQLGFLKLIKGTGIRDREEEYGYTYTYEPPYEVLSNRWISFSQMLRLKLIEEVFEQYYNSHRFDNTVEYAIKAHSTSPFQFFYNLAEYWEQEGLYRVKHSSKKLYTLLYNYLVESVGVPSLVVNELLKLDYLLNERALVLPLPLKKIEIPYFKQRCYDFLNDHVNVEKHLPDYRNLSSKNIFKMVHFEVFDCKGLSILEEYKEIEDEGKIVLLFDYKSRDQIRGKAKKKLVDI